MAVEIDGIGRLTNRTTRTARRSGAARRIDRLRVRIDLRSVPPWLDVVPARVIGVIDGEQTSRTGKTATNPRLIAVATKSTEYAAIRRLPAGKTHRPTSAFGPRTAATMIEAGIRRRMNATARSQKGRRQVPRVA